MKYFRVCTPLEILAVVTAIGLVAGVVVPSVIDTAGDIRPASMAVTVTQVRQQIAYHAAVGDVAAAPSGFPERIEPAWFGQSLPRHVWTGHPMVVLEVDGTAAEIFPPDLAYPAGVREAPNAWYNRTNGAFCALVPDDLDGDEAIVGAFNRVNGFD